MGQIKLPLGQDLLKVLENTTLIKPDVPFNIALNIFHMLQKIRETLDNNWSKIIGCTKWVKAYFASCFIELKGQYGSSNIESRIENPVKT